MKLIKFKTPDFKPFMDKRLEIQRLHFLAVSAAYMISYLIFNPIDTPTASIVLTMIASPLLVFAFYLRTSSFFFVRNWYYVIYLLVASAAFIFTMTLFKHNFYQQKFGVYEISHILASAVVGYSVALAVSVPFKLIQMIVFDTDIYISSALLQKIEYEAFPEKKKKDEEKKSGKFKYDTMNETQLDVELQNAIKEDRYEDADKIKKVLEKKYKYGA